jgi:hypothetical protein
MDFIKIAMAQVNNSIGSFQEEQIYEVAGNMGWLLVFVKGVFWVIVIFLVIVAAIALNQLAPAKKKKIFTCPRCGYSYKEKEWAKKCESWCTKHKSCNLEINKHRVMLL